MKVSDFRDSLVRPHNPFLVERKDAAAGAAPKAEILTFPFEIKSVSEEGVIEGYASTFGNIDLGGDVVDKGAFRKTLRDTKGGKVPVLADHSWNAQIGWGIDGKEDDTGLFVRAKLDVKNNQKAREKYSLAQMALELKVAAGISIGYRTIKAEPDTTNPMIRRLKELRLVEYSLVTFPMNTEAAVTNAKSLALFEEEMREHGYSDEEIKKFFALPPAGAAKAVVDPHAVQSIGEQFKNLTNLLRGA
jgi:HK97 family phage prohead protease